MQTVTYRERVAAEVRAAIARRNIPRADLAEKLGMSSRTLSERLTGRSAFDLDEIRVTADFLGVSLISLVMPECAA